MIRRRISIAPSHAEWLLEVAGDEIDARWAYLYAQRHIGGMTLERIGADHDLSRERVRQLLDAAHTRLVSVASMRPRILPRMAHDALRMLAGQ